MGSILSGQQHPEKNAAVLVRDVTEDCFVVQYTEETSDAISLRRSGGK
jgi:hypothetical protein